MDDQEDAINKVKPFYSPMPPLKDEELITEEEQITEEEPITEEESTRGNESPRPPQQKVSIDRETFIIAVTCRGELRKIKIDKGESHD